MRKTGWIGLFLASGFLLVCAAVLIARPYARAERLVEDTLRRRAPAGTKVGSIDVSFPSNIELTNVSIPVRVNDGQSLLPFGKLSGRLSVLPFLQGRVHAEMNGDIFGGTLWLAIRLDALPRMSSEDSQFVALEARARNLDIATLCNFFQAPIVASGRCDADAEAELDERSLTDSTGWTLVKGEQIDIPRIELDMVSLPPNRQVGLTARLSAEDGTVYIERFELVGTAYDVSGKGRIWLSDPLEDSPIDLSLATTLKEDVSITDDRIAGEGAEHVVSTLIATRSKLFLKVAGTAEHPEVRLDAASSLSSILEQLGR